MDKAEKRREITAKNVRSIPLAGAVWFTAARKLPLGDITIEVNSATTADILRRYANDHGNGWLLAFSRDMTI